jgi:hypothetical protein
LKKQSPNKEIVKTPINPTALGLNGFLTATNGNTKRKMRANGKRTNFIALPTVYPLFKRFARNTEAQGARTSAISARNSGD